MIQYNGQEDRVSVKRSLRGRTLDVMSSLRGRVGQIARFALAFELLRWLVLAPLGAGMLRLGLERWGRCSVGNFEIIAFILSPPGLAALIGVGTIGLTTFYLEVAGLILLLADRQTTWWSVFREMGRRIVLVLGLGFRQLVILIMLAAPFLAAVGVVLRMLWAGRDLNGLIVLKPPVFRIGVTIGACLLGIYAVIGGYLLLRWLLALPAILFEPGTRARKAMTLSTLRTRGRLVSMLSVAVVWLVAVVLLSSVVMAGLRLASAWLLDHTGLSMPVLLPLTAFVLVLHAVVAALLSVLGNASFASLMLVLYQETTGMPSPGQALVRPTPDIPAPFPAAWRITGLAVAVVGVVGLVCYAMLARVRLHERLEITAHRGGASLAPENTIAAIRKAIEARADWAEIDVQRTADGALVVLHDADLVRVGGLQQRVAESTLAQIKSIDVGSRVSGEFRGERVPTLDELIAAAGGRIQLNIELKPNGPDDVAPLVHAVLDSVKRAGTIQRCRLCSQSYEGLQLARRMEPGLQIGFIAGGQIGDLSKLDVSFLMVAERLATRDLVDAAAIGGVKVHAWTINDPELLVPLLDRGVVNVITDDPVAMRRRLEEVQRLSPAERILLRARNLLAD